MVSIDEIFMERAINLAKTRKGLTHPNPTVGCVIVKNGKIVGEGVHWKAGQSHAEVVALQKAGKRAKSSTVYVTLEPCSHYGRTPPCSLALINAGVKRVVIATKDPNPLVAGRGIEMLKKAGIEVKVGVLEKEARKLNRDFFYWITTKRPYVVLKLAQTVDGFIATESGKSKWITSEESRRLVHLLRCQSDAVLVGVGTVLRDDPQLTVRNVPCERQPIRVVLDTHLKIPLRAKILDTSEAPTIIFTSRAKSLKTKLLREKGIGVIPVRRKGKFLDLEEILKILGEKEIVQLLVEGGSKIFGEFLKRDLYQELKVFVAPKVFGKGISPFGGFEVNNPQTAKIFKLESVKELGEDTLLEFVNPQSF